MRRKKVDKHFSGILSAMSVEKQILAADLLREMSFLAETMHDLKTAIKQHGVTELFVQGENEFERQTPAFQAYLAALGKFGALSSKVEHMLPRDCDQDNGGVAAWLQQYNNSNAELQ